MKEIKFLGHIVSQGGISFDPGKVEIVLSWKWPTTITKVISFLGLAGYKGFSQITLPLTKLTRKNALFEWTSECE